MSLLQRGVSYSLYLYKADTFRWLSNYGVHIRLGGGGGGGGGGGRCLGFDCVRIKALWDSFGRQILTQPPVQLSE